MRYEVKGDTLPVLEVILENGESINCEHGAMVWMSNNVKMETGVGGISKMFSKGISGENIFSNTYTAHGAQGMIAFGTNFPGKIVPVEIAPGKELVAQKGAFLAATPGVDISVFFQKKVMSGLFGGEGFIMQKFSGTGLVFLEIDGVAIEYELGAGDQIVIDTGYLSSMDASCSVDVQSVKGVKNMLFGGEGIFNTVVTGPGKITVQTMPKLQVASTLQPYMITSSK